MVIDKNPNETPETRRGANQLLLQAFLWLVAAAAFFVVAFGLIPHYHARHIVRIMSGVAGAFFLILAIYTAWGGIKKGGDFA